MSDLHEELDRALRAVPVPGAPVERARRDGRRLRTRRRATVVAGALAVVAIAAGVPALGGNLTASSGQPSVSTKPDPVVTDAPPAGTTHAASGLAAGRDGVVAQGKAGALRWQAVVTKSSEGTCYKAVISDHEQNSACGEQPSPVSPGQADQVIGIGGDNTVGVNFGITAKDVTYLVVAFTDGQQLKLIPVTAAGDRYVAWATAPSMKVAKVTAYLGGPYTANGQTEIAIPFDLNPTSLYIGRWQKPGQATVPETQETLWHGGSGTKASAVLGNEGPWGTCLVYAGPGDILTSDCRPESGIGSTQMEALLGGNANIRQYAVSGTAAPDVAVIEFTTSGGAKSQATPVKVGDERLFAAPLPTNTGSLTWVAYNAVGQEVGHGTWQG